MKKQTRFNVFETNSSSTHSICVAKNITLTLPDEITFRADEFGWEFSTLNSVYEKASYLYTYFVQQNSLDEFEGIINVLKKHNIEVNIDDSYNNYCYIDHSYELCDFIDDILYDETKLLNFLFSPLSFILSGNDNSGESVDINVDYEYDEYYKGN
jgi:hypothetical protein